MNYSPVASKRCWQGALKLALQQHPRQVLAFVSVLLMGLGGGAYAVASLGPDPSQLPVRQVVELVQPVALASQVEALESHRFNLFRSDITRSTDTADTLLKRLGLYDPAAANFLRTDALINKHILGRAGRLVTAEANDQQGLESLVFRWSPEDNGRFQRLTFQKNANGYRSRIESAALTTSVRMASGTIRTSLFAATDDARLPDSLGIQVAEIFSGDIDFHRALRKGDRFSMVYETLEGDGEALRTGRVLSAEFVNNGKTYQAMWFQDGPLNKGAYYGLDGQSLKRAYLVSPMEFSRVSSGFKMRFHPILQRWRAHLGVDYAAPTGTSVRSVGDGVVEFAGVQNGFGNVVFVKHRNNHTTVYAHLSRIGVRQGQAIAQGQPIGAVGATGWATGPHLHFEFRVNGQHVDPMTLAKQNEAIPVTASARPVFDKHARLVRTQLAAAATVTPSSVE